jgi:hypothetical protein
VKKKINNKMNWKNKKIYVIKSQLINKIKNKNNNKNNLKKYNYFNLKIN